jgi:hypothetical protein
MKGQVICIAEESRSRWPSDMAWVFGCSLAGIAGWNPTGVMDACVLRMLWAVRWSSLRRADHPSRAVLPSVMCLSVFVKARQWGCPVPLRLLRHKKEIFEVNRWELLLKTTWIYLATVPSFAPCDLGRTVKINGTIRGSQKAGALDFHGNNKFWFFRGRCTLYANLLRPCLLCYLFAELVITYGIEAEVGVNQCINFLWEIFQYIYIRSTLNICF